MEVPHSVVSSPRPQQLHQCHLPLRHSIMQWRLIAACHWVHHSTMTQQQASDVLKAMAANLMLSGKVLTQVQIQKCFLSHHNYFSRPKR